MQGLGAGICEAMRILSTPYAPSGKGSAPPAMRPEGMVQTLAALRTLPRMVKDAARVETPFLRVCGARYGYSLKYNMPATKGPQVSAIATQPPRKQNAPSAPPKKAGTEGRPAGRAADRSRPRARSHRASRKVRGGQKTRRSRSPRRPPRASSADTSVAKKVRDKRIAAWLAGEDGKGSLRGKCKNCYVGLGARVSRREGRLRQDLGNQCYLPRRARSYERKNARHWARDCPNRAHLDARARRQS